MPYVETQNMGYKEFAISRAIDELNQRGEVVSLTRLSEYVGLSPRRVTDALVKLEKCGLLRRWRSTRGGYRYEVTVYDPDTVSGL